MAEINGELFRKVAGMGNVILHTMPVVDRVGRSVRFRNSLMVKLVVSFFQGHSFV